MIHQDAKETVGRFWQAMQTNDFKAAAQFLHEDYLLEWPQSGERIRGQANFIAFNENYPASGRWEFTVHRLLAEGDQVVSDVTVTDGTVQARAITFSTVREGRITHQLEFWPGPFDPPDWRRDWVERVPSND